MSRLTEYDEVRGIYKLKVDCNMGENIQKLGRYEDDEIEAIVMLNKIRDIINDEIPFQGEAEKIAKYNNISWLLSDYEKRRLANER